MILFVDLLNTIIQSFIVSYFPYYLSFNKENDRISKKQFVISIIGIFFTSMLATNIFSNGNITTAVIATMNITSIITIMLLNQAATSIPRWLTIVTIAIDTVRITHVGISGKKICK